MRDFQLLLKNVVAAMKCFGKVSVRRSELVNSKSLGKKRQGVIKSEFHLAPVPAVNKVCAI